MTDWKNARHIEVPFTLVLPDAQTLHCTRLLRVLPGRRIVGQVLDGAGQPALMKLFLGKKAWRDAQREVRGVRALIRHGLPTPALLDFTREQHGHPLVLMAWVEQACSFQMAWETATTLAARQALLRELLVLMGQQHRVGLHQTDFHWDNFLLDAQKRVLAIDGDGYRLGRPLSRRRSRQALGELLALVPISDWPLYQALFEVYFQQRDWHMQADDWRGIRRYAHGMCHRRARLLARKSLRECSEFCARLHMTWRMHWRRDFSIQELERWMQDTGLAPTAEDVVLKAGRSQTVWKTQIAGKTVVIKRYNIKNRWHAVRRMLSPSRAVRAWQNAHGLRAYHIPTPRPLAMLEARWGPLRRRAWLLTEEAIGEPADKVIVSTENIQQIRAVAEIVHAFAQNALVHGDMKASNFMVHGSRAQIIDLDAMRMPWWFCMPRRKIIRDCRRFLRNWSNPDIRHIFIRLLAQVCSGIDEANERKG